MVMMYKMIQHTHCNGNGPVKQMKNDLIDRMIGTDEVLIFWISLIHELQYFDLDESLIVKRLFVFDDLDGHGLVCDAVMGSYYLTEGALTQKLLHPIPIGK